MKNVLLFVGNEPWPLASPPLNPTNIYLQRAGVSLFSFHGFDASQVALRHLHYQLILMTTSTFSAVGSYSDASLFGIMDGCRFAFFLCEATLIPVRSPPYTGNGRNIRGWELGTREQK